MDFFCAKCQKRHNVKMISADMWSVCGKQLREEVKNWFESWQNDDHSDNAEAMRRLKDDILTFLGLADANGALSMEPFAGRSADARINAYFALYEGNFKNQLVGMTTVPGKTTGIYIIRLGMVLTLYMHWMDADEACVKLAEQLQEGLRDTVILEQPITITYNDNGTLNRVGDEKDVPFSRKNGEMVGFNRICPCCGRVLSRASGRAEEIVVALAGAARAGKTACLVATISALNSGKFAGAQIIPQAHDGMWTRLEKEVRFYERGEKVEKTPINLNEAPAYSFLIKMKDPHETQRVLTVVDMPGEAWFSEKGLAEQFFRDYAGIYENLDAIWMVISKATICLSGAFTIPEDVGQELNHVASEDVEIIQNAAPERLHTNLDFLRTKLHKKLPPTLVIVSKPDYQLRGEADAGLFPTNCGDIAYTSREELDRLVNINTRELVGMRQTPLWNHAADVRDFIKNTAPKYIEAIEQNCEDRFYMSVSPYGHSASDRTADPDSNVCENLPSAYHELYPFLWTMAIHGAVPISQHVTWITRDILGRVRDEESQNRPYFFRCRREQQVPMLKGNAKIQWEDLLQIEKTIGDNLLMHTLKCSTEVVLNHKRI